MALTPEPISVYSSVPRFIEFLKSGELELIFVLWIRVVLEWHPCERLPGGNQVGGKLQDDVEVVGRCLRVIRPFRRPEAVGNARLECPVGRFQYFLEFGSLVAELDDGRGPLASCLSGCGVIPELFRIDGHRHADIDQQSRSRQSMTPEPNTATVLSFEKAR